jgi:hypothetical protein
LAGDIKEVVGYADGYVETQLRRLDEHRGLFDYYWSCVDGLGRRRIDDWRGSGLDNRRPVADVYPHIEINVGGIGIRAAQGSCTCQAKQGFSHTESPSCCWDIQKPGFAAQKSRVLNI